MSKYIKNMKHTSYIFFATLLVLLASCKPKNGGNKAADAEKPVITVTIEPLRYFAEAIAGPRFSVSTMVPKGSSPETYDPTPRQLVELSRSRAYLGTGHIGFDVAWGDRLRQNAPGVAFFDLSEGIDLIMNEAEHHHHRHAPAAGNYNEAEHHHHHHHGAAEPHIWMSARNAVVIARNICQALCTIDAAGTDFYTARCDSLQQRLELLDRQLSDSLARPDVTRTFIIYHPTLTYFARDYNLHQVSIEYEGKEPSPAQLKELISLCRKEDVKVIFLQPEFDVRNIETILRETGLRAAAINPLSYDWEQEMLGTARQLN